MFYFQQLFLNALNSIDSSGVTGTVVGVAGAVLLAFFLFSFYEAFAAGGDVRMLGISAIKCLIVGLVFASYGTAFREVNTMFNSVGNVIYNASSVGDVFGNWMDQLAAYWQANGNVSMWNLVAGGLSGLLSILLILSAMVIYAVSYVIFTILYAFYGCVLYVTGPFVLAFLPSRGLGHLGRGYLINLITFQAWGLIYGILQVLMTAVNLGSIDAVLGANGVLNIAKGATQMWLLALTSSLFAISIALIPYIASRIVRGDVGSTMMTLVYVMRASATGLARFAVASSGGAGGAGAGAAAAGGSQNTGYLGPTSGGASAAPPIPSPASSAGSSISSSMAPSTPGFSDSAGSSTTPLWISPRTPGSQDNVAPAET